MMAPETPGSGVRGPGLALASPAGSIAGFSPRFPSQKIKATRPKNITVTIEIIWVANPNVGVKAPGEVSRIISNPST